MVAHSSARVGAPSKFHTGENDRSATVCGSICHTRSYALLVAGRRLNAVPDAYSLDYLLQLQSFITSRTMC